MSASALDTWMLILSLKKEVPDGNKIMKLSFFRITVLYRGCSEMPLNINNN